MFLIRKKFRFEASHLLPHHDGKCARLHGHSWNGELVCVGAWVIPDGPKQGMVIDFSDIKAALGPMLENQLDHWHLNDTLGIESPTSEAVAMTMYHTLKTSLPSLCAVVIEETCTSRCEYWPERSVSEVRDEHANA